MIEGDRWKAARRLLPCFAFVAAAGVMVRDGQNVLVGVAAIAFFGVCAVLYAALAIRPARLILTDEGLDYRGLRSWRLAWSAIAGLRSQAVGGFGVVLIEIEEASRQRTLFGRQRSRLTLRLLGVLPDEVCRVIESQRAAARLDRPDLPERIAIESDASVAPPRWAFPWVGLGLVVVLCLVYVAEVRFPATPGGPQGDPSLQTLAAFGGSSRALIFGEAQWSRLVTASWLHGSIAHLVGNGIALVWAGCILEGVAGRAWFAAIYALGGLAGTLASILFNPADTVGVGASGAITALFAATYVLSFHYRGSKGWSRLQSRAVGMLFPALFSGGGSVGTMKIDVAAHAGGAVVGVLVGFLLLRGWTREARHPARRRVALAVIGSGCALVVAAIWPTLQDYRRIAGYAGAGVALEAGSRDDAAREIEDYVVRFPNDAAGWHLKGDVAFARAESRDALDAYRRSYDLEATQPVLDMRGLAAFYAGDRAGAAADLERAAATDSTDAYAPIWLEIVRERQGLAPSRDATAGAAAAGWPRPVMALLLGSISPDALRALAARLPRDAHDDANCEAGFYIAEWDLIHGRAVRADQGFRAAAATCPPLFIETWMARSELGATEAMPDRPADHDLRWPRRLTAPPAPPAAPRRS